MQELEAICQCQAGDLAALGVLFELHHEAVFRTAYGIVRNHDLAEDVTQEVFIELPTSIKRFDQRRPFPPWLYTIVVRRSLRVLGHRRDRDVPIDDDFDLPSQDLSPEEEAERLEQEKAVWNAVVRLSANHRAVVVLFYYHGFSVAEISKALGCPRVTVRTRLYNARVRLRDALRGLREPPTDPEPGLAIAIPKQPPESSDQDWPMQIYPNTEERRMKWPVLSIQRKVR